MADNNTNELDALMISELPTQATANETDLFEVAIVDANSASGYASKKESAAAIADAIIGEYQYPLRITGTTAKTIAGAINELKNLVDLLPQFAIEVVQTLPVSDISTTTIYLVPASNPEQGNYYEEYIYVNNAWELVGTTAVDLSGYYTSAQVDTLLAAKADSSSLAPVATSGAYSDLTGKPTIDSALDNTSTNAVENRAVTGAIEEIESELSSPDTSDNEPYLLRDSASGTADRMVDELVGGTIAFNQLVDLGMTSVAVPNEHKYLSKINGVVSIGISAGTEISINDATQDNIFDLTRMFGSATAIIDYIYSLEQATEGAGVAFFRNLFSEDYYAYNAGELISVKATAHKMRDASDNVIGDYPLDANLELRGLFKLDANNKLYCDGDTYESSGKVTRKYGIVDLGSLTWSKTSINYFYATISDSKTYGSCICSRYAYNYQAIAPRRLDKTINLNQYFGHHTVSVYDTNYNDATAFKTAMSGVYFVYELATPTTETAASFATIQVVDGDGTEEYVDSRSVPIPVGHNTTYIHGLNEYRTAVESYLASLDARITALENASSTRSLSVSPVLTKSIVSDSSATEDILEGTKETEEETKEEAQKNDI